MDIKRATGGTLTALSKVLGCQVEDLLEYDYAGGNGGIRMIYVCDACKYLFASDEESVADCPDCGKHRIRPATEEIKKYDERRKEAKEWHNEAVPFV